MPQRYDRTFKLLTDESPRAALALFAGIPLSTNLDVEILDRELNLTALRVDNLYRCRDGKSEFLVHLEAVARYKRTVLERQLDYAQAIAAKYNLPCRSYLVLLAGRGVPRSLPVSINRSRGDLRLRLRLRVVRLWEIPAETILSLNSDHLLPWTPLLDASRAQINEAADRLRASRRDDLSSRLVLLGGLRYGSREAFLQRLNDMVISEEVLQYSSTYRWIKEHGLKEGLKEGRQEGLREALESLLVARFGELPVSAKSRLKSAKPERLTKWLKQSISAPTLKDALK